MTGGGFGLLAMTNDSASSASWKNLRLRSELLRRVRAFFEQRDFLEVETPLLSVETVIDTHLEPVEVTLPGESRSRFLQTSPELAMKRLLSGDAPDRAEAIYQVTRAFRGGEAGARHNPEFTIVEWYRLGDGYTEGKRLLAELAQALFDADAVDEITYREAFVKYAEFDPFAVDTAELPSIATAAGLAVPAQMGDDRDAWLDLFLSEVVAPNLGTERPTILCDYPASQAALAKLSVDDPAVAERFELFYRGVELANGYHELCDADELRERFETANTQRVADGRRALPLPEQLLAAMDSGLPACSGCALGFDRAVMLAVGAKSLGEVMPFTIERA